jgi:hypothetical protein
MSLADLRKPQPKVDRKTWPAWVRFPLLGLDSRTAASVFFWVSVVLLLGFAAMGFFKAVFFAGAAVMLIAVVGYHCAIRWVDRNSRWS